MLARRRRERIPDVAPSSAGVAVGIWAEWAAHRACGRGGGGRKVCSIGWGIVYTGSGRTGDGYTSVVTLGYISIIIRQIMIEVVISSPRGGGGGYQVGVQGVDAQGLC